MNNLKDIDIGLEYYINWNYYKFRIHKYNVKLNIFVL